jgi:hypothetical protein
VAGEASVEPDLLVVGIDRDRPAEVVDPQPEFPRLQCAAPRRL